MARRGQPKPKKVPYELIGRDDEPEMYQRLGALVNEHHRHLKDARIGLAWCDKWKRSVDGRLTLGMCRKASDLDRELADFDFLILVNRTFWQSGEVSAAQRTALLDHELCHAEVAKDKYGDPRRDERGRKVWRLRHHDVEEFAAIIERHGCYKRDLELFAASLKKGEQARLEFEEQKDRAAKTPKLRRRPRPVPAASRSVEEARA